MLHRKIFWTKRSLLPSYCPPLIMDPKSMLVELRPPTMVELRAVVELRSLSSRREMVPWHRVICPFHAWFPDFLRQNMPLFCPNLTNYAAQKDILDEKGVFSLPSGRIFRVREHRWCPGIVLESFGPFQLVFLNRKEFPLSKYVIISSKTYQLCCIERYFGRKGSLLPSYCPPLIMDPKSMLVELRPPTMVELRAVVELRSLSSRHEMGRCHHAINTFNVGFHPLDLLGLHQVVLK